MAGTYYNAILRINAQTGTSYTLSIADFNSDTITIMDNASANTVTVPPSVFPIGAQLLVAQEGLGQTSFLAGAGVTINAIGLSISSRYKSVALIQVALNEWDAYGTLDASLYTARTTAFATATAITDTTILNALNTFDLGLISNGLDTKMKALYPFVGGTATTQKYNFMDARDLNAAFRLTFYGGGTHNSNGYQPNNTNAYGDTYFNPAVETSVSLDDIAIGTYLRDNNEGKGDIGAYPNSGSGGVSIMARYTGETNAYYRCNSSLDITISGVTTAVGFNIISNPSTNLRKFYKNNSIINTNTSITAGLEINDVITIGKIASSLYSGRQTAFSFISSGLTDTDASNLYTLVQAFQTSLSRQV